MLILRTFKYDPLLCSNCNTVMIYETGYVWRREYTMKLKNPNQIEFICLECGTKEKIPLKIVRFLDENDQDGVDTEIPPRFDCQKCSGK